jgi:hypothetical protein
MKQRLSLCLTAALLAAGCGSQGPALPEAFPVKGKVLLASGQPLRTGRVTFHPKDQTAGIEPFAEIQPDGSFTLTTYRLNDGAVPGRYVVTITPYSYKTGNLKVSKASQIPRRFWEKETSNLVIDIKAEDNLLPPFTLR